LRLILSKKHLLSLRIHVFILNFCDDEVSKKKVGPGAEILLIELSMRQTPACLRSRKWFKQRLTQTGDTHSSSFCYCLTDPALQIQTDSGRQSASVLSKQNLNEENLIG